MTALIFAGLCDIAGKVRGKAFPADQIDYRLSRGIGWTPTNVQITCFDHIAKSPFGALGDLLLIPDPDAEARLEFEDTIEHFILGDVMTLEGTPWALCTRSLLKAALERLDAVAGLRLRAAFEHEFQILEPPARRFQSYGREGFELQRPLCERLVEALAAAGLRPDSVMKEYGANQYEIVIGAELGHKAADAAVILREVTRSLARHLGETATFTPIIDPSSVGNGVHVHMSLERPDGTPVTHEPDGPSGLSEVASAFAGGILKYINQFLAITAPSVISYQRLTPHRWSAAFNNLGFRDREAALRICPVTALDPKSLAGQFNLEYRAADAAASPYLLLAALVHAGTQGIEEGLSAPRPTEEDLSRLPAAELAARGLVPLPKTLEAALERLEASSVLRRWFPDPFVDVYLAHKAGEIAYLAEMSIPERHAAYAEAY